MIQKHQTTITPFGLSRTLHIYLPDDWETSGRRYPVLYMFDGHNLFFDQDATYGKCWGLKDYLDRTHTQVIVVGVECNHEGNNRLSEYCPYDVPDDWWGGFDGRGTRYMDWLVGELKPQVDQYFPTLPDRSHTLIGGSSMGGLMSLYALGCYNHVFSRGACLSPSVRLCYPQLWADLEKSSVDPDTRAYISWGSEEVRDKQALAKASADNLALAHLMSQKGADVYPYLNLGGGHNEASWEREIPLFIEYLMEWN